jgi:phage regulator Rha-like protein
MKTSKAVQPALDIASAILTVRGERVLLDNDLARIYGVQTKVLNQAVRRNLAKFPEDFRFQLTPMEADEALRLRSQFVTLKPGRGQHRKYLSWAFTEHGAIMAANVLNSPRAVQMSVFVVRAFLKMRELLGGTQELARQLRELEAKLTARLDGHESAIVDVLQRLMRLLDPPPAPEPPRRQIGFHVKPESGTEDKVRAKKK